MELHSHIEQIRQKLQEKLKRMEVLKKENEKLHETVAQFKAHQVALEEELKNLREQNYLLKAATGKMEEKDKLALEQSINKYIKDIDKCLALLSE